MAGYYGQWVAKEMEWAEEIGRKAKRTMGICGAVSVLAFPVLSLVIGLGNGSENLLASLLVSLLVGLACGSIFLVIMLASNPVKAHGKSLQKNITEVLSETEKENLAEQMLGIADPNGVREVAWVDEMKEHHVVRITKDYATFASQRLGISLVQLWKVERIELDARDDTFRVRSGGMKVSVTETSFPIYFYYKDSVAAAKREADVCFVFSSRGLRDEVMGYIRELGEGSK